MAEQRVIKNSEQERLSKTAEKILLAAQAVFAEHGYSGTRMDEIARRAAVNKATIYYQIGDKDMLYANVIHQVIGSVARDIARTVEIAAAPEDKLKAYIFCIARAVDNNPDLPPVMMREIASGGAHLPQVVIEDVALALKTLLTILQKGTKKGLFIETDPYLLHMMILGSILLYRASLPIKNRQTWLPEELRNGNKHADIAGEVARLVLRAVKK